jgi:hypothetical protein
MRGLLSLGVGQVSYRRRQQYVISVDSRDRAKVLWFGEGKGRETVHRFFKEVLTQEDRERISSACPDRVNAYIEAIK